MIKKFFKYFFWYTFWFQIQIIRTIKKPYIVLIIWGSKKSILIQKLFKLAEKKNIFFNKKYYPYNTWFWVALNFLQLPSAFSNYKKWFYIYHLSWIKFFYYLFFFPKYIFLEGGLDEVEEANKFIFLLKPSLIVFTPLESVFIDDFDLQKRLEEAFNQFVKYLNKKSTKLDYLDKQMYLDEFFQEIILKQNKYIGVFSSNITKLTSIKDKLKRKIILLNN